MKQFSHSIILLILCLTCISAQAHDHALLSGTVTDSASGQAIIGATIILNNGQHGATADAFGNFRFTKLVPGEYTIRISSLGFSTRTATISLQPGEHKIMRFHLKNGPLLLAEVTVAQQTGNQNQTLQLISKIDTELRPVNSAQDLMRLVPGLFIAQHAGGGKAEQIFLRGFDVDHGTDFAVSVDGIPVNMVSHAHGQGYADFHFVIPETIEALEVSKGPYNTRFGNFATAGAGAFTTKKALQHNMVKLEAGRFNTYRALAMVNLLGNRHLLTHKHPENAYIASEYVFSDSYFESPQNLKRFNIFGKYSGMLNERTSLTFSASTFRSRWDASGQIPQRAVDSGQITRFGSIDNSEGGTTDRTNLNIEISTFLYNDALIRNQIFYSNYHFDLYSNFTFFLEDEVNGDGIRQTENGRNIYGYNGTYENSTTIGCKKLNSTYGIGMRLDDGRISLERAVRRQVLATMVAGDLIEKNLFAYTDHTLALTERLSVNAGLRYDYFHFGFRDNTNEALSGKAGKDRVSPKLSLFYTVNPSVQLFARSGMGFHSNDSRAVVANQAANVLPRAIGYEVGSTFKLTPRMLFNVALWNLDLEDELVYVGDEGIVENAGSTRRFGTDIAVRYQLSELFFADADFNFNHGRLREEAEGENYIPLAPSFTSIGGISLKQERGLNASVRYRYVDSRPANETRTVMAEGYFLLDAVASYRWKKVQAGFTIENLLNADWNEAQFDTESRLRNEAEPVSELHFTPGTPFFLKATIAYLFN